MVCALAAWCHCCTGVLGSTLRTHQGQRWGRWRWGIWWVRVFCSVRKCSGLKLSGLILRWHLGPLHLAGNLVRLLSEMCVTQRASPRASGVLKSFVVSAWPRVPPCLAANTCQSVPQALSVGSAFSTCRLLVQITVLTANLLCDMLQCLTENFMYSWTKSFVSCILVYRLEDMQYLPDAAS